MILDTSAVIDLFKEDGDLIEALKDIPSHKIAITSITVFELHQGIKSHENSLQEFINTVRVIDLDKSAAATAGELMKLLRTSGKIIDAEDCMIAGICLQYDLPILTKNVKHFGRIKGLETLSY